MTVGLTIQLINDVYELYCGANIVRLYYDFAFSALSNYLVTSKTGLMQA